jgi:hypothetical protein
MQELAAMERTAKVFVLEGLNKPTSPRGHILQPSGLRLESGHAASETNDAI